MSKEAMHRGVKCACGQVFAFPEYHWPHCPFNPVNMSATAKAEPQGIGAQLLKSLQAKFSKAELQTIASHGPVADKPVGKKRGKKVGKRG